MHKNHPQQGPGADFLDLPRLGPGIPPGSALPLKSLLATFLVFWSSFYLTFGTQRGARGEGPSRNELDLQPPLGLARARPSHPITPPGPFNRLAGYGVSSRGKFHQLGSGGFCSHGDYA